MVIFYSDVARPGVITFSCLNKFWCIQGFINKKEKEEERNIHVIII